jgi:hypothetical protein
MGCIVDFRKNFGGTFIMKKIVGRLLSVLLIAMLALAGCGTKDAGTAGGSASTETEQASVKSKVKFDGTYTAGDTVKIQMDLTKKGTCDYGYIGMYKLVTNEDGMRILNLIYYGEENAENSSDSQLAYDSYAIQQNEDGTYTRCKYTEGETPDFSTGTQMSCASGDDQIMNGEQFGAEYTSDGGAFVKLNEDGTFMFGVHMNYAADKKQFELIGASGSSVYTYETDDDQNSIVLSNEDGNIVMSLERKES